MLKFTYLRSCAEFVGLPVLIVNPLVVGTTSTVPLPVFIVADPTTSTPYGDEQEGKIAYVDTGIAVVNTTAYFPVLNLVTDDTFLESRMLPSTPLKLPQALH